MLSSPANPLGLSPICLSSSSAGRSLEIFRRTLSQENIIIFHPFASHHYLSHQTRTVIFLLECHHHLRELYQTHVLYHLHSDCLTSSKLQYYLSIQSKLGVGDRPVSSPTLQISSAREQARRSAGIK